MLDLKIEDDFIVIEGNNEIFKDTEYFNKDFKLYFERMETKDLFHLELLGEKIKDEKDEDKLVKYGIDGFVYIFRNKLKKWENIGNNEKELSLNKKNKELFIRYQIDFVSLVAEAFKNELSKEEEHKKKLLKK